MYRIDGEGVSRGGREDQVVGHAVALRGARHLKNFFLLFSILKNVCFLLFFIWSVIFYLARETAEAGSRSTWPSESVTRRCAATECTAFAGTSTVAPVLGF